MAASITHAKVVNIAQVPDPTQEQLDGAIALGQYPVGTVLADIALGSDHNGPHTFSGLVQSPASSVAGQVPMFGALSDVLATASFLAGFDTAVGINDTIPVAYFSAYDTGYADVDVAIVPKGAGAFMLTVPDGAIAGGNKRGQYAVDLQISRDIADKVASGFSSTQVGSQNRTSGSNSTSVGSTNINDGSGNTLIGKNNRTTAGVSTTMCGSSNVSAGSFCSGLGVLLTFGSGVWSSVGLGYQCVISGSYSAAIGYRATIGAAASYTLAMGTWVTSSALGAFVIGKGVSNVNRLNNTVANSMWFAMNSTVPSLAIWNAGGAGLYGKVSIGSATAPADDCLFEVASTTKAARPVPVMTAAQRDAIATPGAGMFIYNSDTSALNVYTTAWGAVGGGAGASNYTGIIDFGATPTDEASLVITGLADMTTSAHIRVWLQEDDTTVGLGGLENTPNGHEILSFFAVCTAATRVLSTGFTAKLRLLAGRATGKYKLHYTYSV